MTDAACPRVWPWPWESARGLGDRRRGGELLKLNMGVLGVVSLEGPMGLTLLLLSGDTAAGTVALLQLGEAEMGLESIIGEGRPCWYTLPLVLLVPRLCCEKIDRKLSCFCAKRLLATRISCFFCDNNLGGRLTLYGGSGGGGGLFSRYSCLGSPALGGPPARSNC